MTDDRCRVSDDGWPKSTVVRCLSSVDRRLSTADYGPSTINYEPSIINYRWPTSSGPDVYVRLLPSSVFRHCLCLATCLSPHSTPPGLLERERFFVPRVVPGVIHIQALRAWGLQMPAVLIITRLRGPSSVVRRPSTINQ